MLQPADSPSPCSLSEWQANIGWDADALSTAYASRILQAGALVDEWWWLVGTYARYDGTISSELPLFHDGRITTSNVQVRWEPPPEGTIKINVDAAVFQGRGTTAAVCRNHNAEYMGSSAFVIKGLIDPASLEAIACREALSLAEDLGLQDLVIASDCSTVVKHIKESSGGNYGGVIKEIRSWQTIFNSCIYIL